MRCAQGNTQKSHQEYVLRGYPIALQPDEKHVNDGKQAAHAAADEGGGAKTPGAKFDEMDTRQRRSARGKALAGKTNRRKYKVRQNLY